MQQMKPSLHVGHIPGPPSMRPESVAESEADESLPPSIELPSEPDGESVAASMPLKSVPEHATRSEQMQAMKERERMKRV